MAGLALSETDRHRLLKIAVDLYGLNARGHLEKQPAGQFRYPEIIQSGDGLLQAVYSCFVEDGKSMKPAAFDERWIRAGY